MQNDLLTPWSSFQFVENTQKDLEIFCWFACPLEPFCAKNRQFYDHVLCKVQYIKLSKGKKFSTASCDWQAKIVILAKIRNPQNYRESAQVTIVISSIIIHSSVLNNPNCCKQHLFEYITIFHLDDFRLTLIFLQYGMGKNVSQDFPWS